MISPSPIAPPDATLPLPLWPARPKGARGSTYTGGKGQPGVVHRIIGQMPPHRFYIEPFLGYGRVFFAKRPADTSLLIDKCPSCIARVPEQSGVEVVCGDALSILPRVKLPPDAVVYCDPPYVLSTRQGRFYYDHEMTEEDHARLLALLQGLGCRVLISGYANELYSAALRDWRCLSYEVMTRGKKATEQLWCNFPEPTELHDWRYAGRSYRQRLSFKRLAARWLARIDVMPPLKRGYVLNAIAERQTWRGPRQAPDLALRTAAPDPAAGGDGKAA
jgi:hypothetical protein